MKRACATLVLPVDWHGPGILALNAAVLIAVFALRLSAGGQKDVLTVMSSRYKTSHAHRFNRHGFISSHALCTTLRG